MSWWKVYLNGKLIDEVYYDKSYKTADEVKQSLINHDNYNPNIIVTH